jgi:hypothetical protein
VGWLDCELVLPFCRNPVHAGCCVPRIPPPFPRRGLCLQQVVAGVPKPGVHCLVCVCPETRKIGRANCPSLLTCIAGGAVRRRTGPPGSSTGLGLQMGSSGLPQGMDAGGG